MEQKFYNWRPFRILLIGIISFWIIYSFVLVMMILRFLKKVYRPTLKAIEDIKTASTSQDFDAVINTLSFQEIYDLAFLLSQQSQHAAIGKTTQLVAHDVRKPFTQIKLILSMFKKFASSPKKLEEAKLEVEHSIENVEAMLKEIMDSTRSFSFKQEAVSLFELFDLSVRQLSVVDRRSKVDLAYDFRHSSKAYVDKDKIVRCLTNILENAVEATTKSTSKGKGRIFVTSKDQDGQIRIIISNNGPIINDEDIAKVFDPFYTKGKVTGTGLGLASVRRIITLHGGKVIAQNKATMDGVEFVITIPASKTPDGNIKAKSLPGRI